MNSILSKLKLLIVSVVLLAVVVTASLWNLKREQQLNNYRLERIILIQSKVDLLRSQLWVFLQYADKNSLEEVYIAQQSLSTSLNTQFKSLSYIKNLQQMNQSLAVLLLKERSLYQSKQGIYEHSRNNESSNGEALALLHSRYNMIAQSMTEELYHLQKSVLTQNQRNQESDLLAMTVTIFLFTSFVVVLSLLIYKQFKVGSILLKAGIHSLSTGDLSSRISTPKLDKEFLAIANFFNEMKSSLQQNIITKTQLENEIDSKTSFLKQQKDRLKYLSEHDPLTGVLNRRSLYIQLESEINGLNRTDLMGALLFLDLDNFKQINDTKGHHVGDKVLVTYVSRLKDNTRPTDFIGRVGGDEFIICMNALRNTEAIELKLESLLNILEQPMDIEGESFSVMCSIGVSLYPQQSSQIDELLEIADQAMYKAKQKQGCTYYGVQLVEPSEDKAS
ncbi:diguanylate cyclase [Vibrio sp. ZSDE26]|uniref:Diguanylate cyclase n=1 Tax=Vibrio amylolyticus TaxID=2847292 RepID=A0A9X1XF52_9VIBR|nr:diguanylate cyclase [Vibrio amylolyticus]MCK6261794.1 diguanylate cyclase [Vibrio amylolyticus]